MRTTVDIPDELYRAIKAEAAMRGRPVRELVVEGLRRVLATDSDEGHSRRAQFPLIRTQRPGSLSLEALREAEERSYADEDESRGCSL